MFATSCVKFQLRKQFAIFCFQQVFGGNVDQNIVVYHEFSPPIKARYIRIRPMEWHGHISMRVELYGCPGTVRQLHNLEDLQQYNISFILLKKGM